MPINSLICVGNKMMKILPLLLCLLWCLVEVHLQTVPYVSFRGTNLPNHSYVDLSLVGEDQNGSDSNTVQCHTNRRSCCRTSHGDWYTPEDTELPFSDEQGDIYENHGDQVIHLKRRNNANRPSGIYRCLITTYAVYRGEIVYVGLYPTGEGILRHGIKQYVLCMA